ncbi:MAG TPA: glycogen synthase GlgA [Crenalkalicoccus sp.]|nr:glycogen synthase GlgA [Crenalkalicoccus sp.]
MPPLRVLAVASEAFPLVKTGGLGDVVGALPVALAPEQVAVTTLLPGYPAVLAALDRQGEPRPLPPLFDGPVRLLPGRAAGLDLLVLEAPHLFDRPGNPYQAPDGTPWPDNDLRFAALGRAAAFAAEGFDAVHAHDWQAGLVPAYLRHGSAKLPRCLFTLHNLAFQGQFPASLFPQLGLPAAAFRMEGVEYHGSVGFLKAGLFYADRVTTVSPTYAAEIRTPEGGMGLDGLLRGRGAVLSGILNGLDTVEWDPAADPHLPACYGPGNVSPRAANKAALQARFALQPDPATPLFGFIGRLAWQKGVDLVLEALPWLLEAGGQLVILGSGDPVLEERCRGAAASLPGQVGAITGYDEALAHLVQGGADSILVPSRFEPCGLTQLCALRYGAPPIVARTGGLADTVVDANEMALAAGAGSGFQVRPDSAPMLGEAIARAAALLRDPDGAWQRLQANAMATDVSWRRSAARYAALLREIAAPG